MRPAVPLIAGAALALALGVVAVATDQSCPPRASTTCQAKETP